MPLEAIRFERPLRDVQLVSGSLSSEPVADQNALARAAELERRAAEVAAAREAGYRQGRADADAAFTEQLMAQRQEVLALAEGVLRKLSEQEAALAAQARAGVPGLVMNIVRRVLAGCESNAGQVRCIVEQAMAETPQDGERSLEVFLCPADLVLLENMHGEALRAKYPRVVLRADATLAPGDCLVRGNFGLIDGRMETKLKAVERLLEAH